MPAIGGLKVPHSPELWNQVKELVIQGLAYKDIAARTGLREGVIRNTASVRKWTIAKAENKAKADLESLRPKLHKHLHRLVDSKVLDKECSTVRKLQEHADAVHTLSQATKLVEAWQDNQEQTLVNVLQISNSVTANPDPIADTAIDAQVVDTTEDYSI